MVTQFFLERKTALQFTIDYNEQVLDLVVFLMKPPGYGCGQGNRGGPSFWVLISTLLLKTL